MDVELALGSARRLSVDVANLSFRVALLETEREHMTQLALLLTPGTWKRSMHPVRQESLVSDPDDSSLIEVEAMVMITGEQVGILDALLAMFHEPL